MPPGLALQSSCYQAVGTCLTFGSANMAQYDNVEVVYFECHCVEIAGSEFTAIGNVVFRCLGLGHGRTPSRSLITARPSDTPSESHDDAYAAPDQEPTGPIGLST